jgi:hypothetical protein
MIENTVKQEVGTTTMKVKEVLGYEEKLNDKKTVISALNEEVATLKERIVNYKAILTTNNPVLREDYNGHIVAVNNPDVWKTTFENEYSKKLVKTELDLTDVESRLRQKKADFDRLKQEHQIAMNEVTLNHEEKVKDIKRKNKAVEAELIEKYNDVVEKIKDKSEEQKLQKQIVAFRDTVAALTEKFKDIAERSLFNKILNKFSFVKSYKFWREELNELLAHIEWKLSREFDRINFEKLPKTLNKYATCNILEERNSDPERYNLRGDNSCYNIKWIKVQL